MSIHLRAGLLGLRGRSGGGVSDPRRWWLAGCVVALPLLATCAGRGSSQGEIRPVVGSSAEQPSEQGGATKDDATQGEAAQIFPTNSYAPCHAVKIADRGKIPYPCQTHPSVAQLDPAQLVGNVGAQGNGMTWDPTEPSSWTVLILDDVASMVSEVRVYRLPLDLNLAAGLSWIRSSDSQGDSVRIEAADVNVGEFVLAYRVGDNLVFDWDRKLIAILVPASGQGSDAERATQGNDPSVQVLGIEKNFLPSPDVSSSVIGVNEDFCLCRLLIPLPLDFVSQGQDLEVRVVDDEGRLVAGSGFIRVLSDVETNSYIQPFRSSSSFLKAGWYHIDVQTLSQNPSKSLKISLLVAPEGVDLGSEHPEGVDPQSIQILPIGSSESSGSSPKVDVGDISFGKSSQMLSKMGGGGSPDGGNDDRGDRASGSPLRVADLHQEQRGTPSASEGKTVSQASFSAVSYPNVTADGLGAVLPDPRESNESQSIQSEDREFFVMLDELTADEADLSFMILGVDETRGLIENDWGLLA